ncbi:MAG: hypothetical protein HOB26_10190 [Flavobacteriales bacterium]|jgi:hypothetical protein|nr:hypothetical protein [Flavobacteriales bacterium]
MNLKRNIKSMMLFAIFMASYGLTVAQNNYFNLEKQYFINGDAKNFAVISAKYSSKAMHFSEKLFFGKENIDSFSDSISFNTQKAIEFGEKAIETANDTSVVAKSYMKKSLKRLHEAQESLNSIIGSSSPNEKRNTYDLCIFWLGDATIDSYNASIYFYGELAEDVLVVNDGLSANTPCPVCPPCDTIFETIISNSGIIEGGGDNASPLSAEELNRIRRIEVDEATYTTIVEMYEKRMATKQQIIDQLLKDLANANTDEERQKIQNEIDIAKAQKELLADKRNGAESKLKSIREQLAEYAKRDGYIKSDSNSTSIFSFGKEGYYNENNPIPVDQPFPDGLIYSVQLGLYHKQLIPSEYDIYKGLYPINGQSIAGGLYRYRTGIFYNYQQVEEIKIKIRSIGLSDAFVIAFYNGELISVSKAIRIERQ